MVHKFTFYVCFDYDSTPVHNLLSWSHREKGMWIEMIHFQNFWNFYQSYVWTCLSPPLRNIRKNIFRHKNLVGSQVTIYYLKWEKACCLELQLVYLGRFPWTANCWFRVYNLTVSFNNKKNKLSCEMCSRTYERINNIMRLNLRLFDRWLQVESTMKSLLNHSSVCD